MFAVLKLSRVLLGKSVDMGLKSVSLRFYHPITSKLKNSVLQMSKQLIERRSTKTWKVKKFVPQYSKDLVNKQYEFIMDSGIKNYIFWCPALTYTLMIPTSLACIYHMMTKFDSFDKLHPGHPALVSFCVASFGLILMLIVNSCVKRCVLRMYHQSDTDKFIAILLKWNLQPFKIEFMPKECKRLPVSQMFGSMKGNIKIKDRPFLLVCSDFKVPVHYNRIMGYHLDRKAEEIADPVGERMPRVTWTKQD